MFNLTVGKDIFKIDQLTAMHLAKKSWYVVTQETLANCRRHTDIISDISRVLVSLEMLQMLKAF